MDLNTIWFVLVGVLIAGYGVLDGFDLGVGVLHLFARSEEERLVHVKAIGPVWDGNEVWLLTGGGALFAAFPAVYATVFSGLYLALMLLLVALIARAVSLEYRHQLEGARWRRFWDFAFGIGSLVPALLFGVAVGNVLRGVPVGAGGEWQGTFPGLLNPYALLVGLVTLTFFTMHGAVFLRMKAEGALAERLARWTLPLWGAFAALFVAATAASAEVSPWLFDDLTSSPLRIVLAIALAASLVAVPALSRAGRTGAAFVASSATMVTMVFCAAASAFPRLVPSSVDLAYSLTAYNAASSHTTLTVMLVIALLGMPLVIGYQAFIYRVFRGKVSPASEGYGAVRAMH
jgi:cytochrome d ubiquinol oxidase subunit II